jgi:2-iminobutanoate/2-iminopropanoate deaminase
MQKAIETANAPRPQGHYSQAVRVGHLLFVSGQLPFDQDANPVKGSIAEEASQALLNVRAIVQAAGGTITDIVQCIIYIADLSLWDEVNKVYGEFFAMAPVLPARAVVSVKELHYGARIEIQATAVLKGE